MVWLYVQATKYNGIYLQSAHDVALILRSELTVLAILTKHKLINNKHD